MSQNRIGYLDGLRGILALMVFAHHFLYAFYPELVFGGDYTSFKNTGTFSLTRFIALSPFNLLYNPGAAIHCFFLLSGYVQSYSYFRHERLLFLQKSFIKRYFRLAVPVLAVVLLVFIFHKNYWIIKNGFPSNALTDKWVQSLMPDNLGFWQVIKHGLLDCFNTSSRYYQVLWTMPTELFNSWLILVLLFVTHQLRRRSFLLYAWLMFQLGVLQAWYGAAFTIGVLIAHVDQQTRFLTRLKEQRLLRYLLLCTGLYFASYPFTGYQGAVEHSIYAPISFFETYPHIISYLFGVTCLFLFLPGSAAVRSCLNAPVLQFTGQISFMLYLLHLLLIFSFSPWMYRLLLPALTFPAAVLATGLLTLLVCVLLSWLLFLLVDRPALQLGNRLADILTRP